MTDSPPNITPEEIPPAEPLSVERLLETLPAQPGVYIMKDDKGKVIYVGKAANLRSRVRSYFRDKGDERLHVPFIRSRVADVETIVTDTEKEALLLENVLIKKHRPRYNIQLRDDKTYISLRLDTAHEWPRIHRIRKRRAGDKALYFGPFSSSSSVRETMRFLQRIFPLRSCPDNVLRNRTRPCASFINDQGINFSQILDCRRITEKNAMSGTAPRSDHDRHRCCQAKCAWASNDQNRHCVNQGVNPAGLGPKQTPSKKSEQGNADNGHHEPARHGVSHSLHRRFGALRLGHHLNDLRQHGG